MIAEFGLPDEEGPAGLLPALAGAAPTLAVERRGACPGAAWLRDAAECVANVSRAFHVANSR